MKLGLRLPTFSLGGDFSSFETLKNYVQQAEELGVEGFFTIDHLLITPPAYTTSWHDALTTLSFVAAVTRRARIGTMVLVLPIRNPYFLAKQVATLDVYSGGRFILGAGVGWHEREFELAHVQVAKRGRMMDEYLELLKSLWGDGAASFEGQFFHVHDLQLLPKPTQKPHPPIWIGGGTQPFEKIYGQEAKRIDRVLYRTAKQADGWIPHSSAAPEMVSRDWEKLKKFAEEAGRDPYSINRVYSNFIYIQSPSEQISEVERKFRLYSGMDHDYWEQFYLLGTVEKLAEKIRLRIEVLEGVDWVVLNPVTFEEKQLKLISQELYPLLV